MSSYVILDIDVIDPAGYATYKELAPLPFTRFFAPGTHDWHQFIPPEDLSICCKNNNLMIQRLRGIQPGISKLKTALEIMRLKHGQINFAEFGRRLKFQQSSSLSGS